VQEKHLVEVHQRGEHITAEIAELFSVARSTGYRAIQRAGDTAASACVVQLSRRKRAFCAEEYGKGSAHTRLHNRENTMAVMKETPENDNYLVCRSPSGLRERPSSRLGVRSGIHAVLLLQLIFAS